MFCLRFLSFVGSSLILHSAVSSVLLTLNCSFSFLLYCLVLNGSLFGVFVWFLWWWCTFCLVIIMNFLMSLYSSLALNVFGFGMSESPFLRRFRCVLVMVGSFASNTISLSSLLLFSFDLYGSIKDSLNSIKDS